MTIRVDHAVALSLSLSAACTVDGRSGCEEEDCIAGPCVQTPAPFVEYLKPSTVSSNSTFESILHLGVPTSADIQCEAPIECNAPDELQQEVSCRMPPDPRTLLVSVLCDSDVALLEIVVSREGDPTYSASLHLVFGDNDRLTGLRVERPDLVAERAYAYDSAEAQEPSLHSLRSLYYESQVDRTVNLVFDRTGFPVFARTTEAPDVRYSSAFVYSEENPEQMVVHEADFEDDSEADEVNRFLYDDEGRVIEVLIERDGNEEFVLAGRCCSDLCGGERVRIAPIPDLL